MFLCQEISIKLCQSYTKTYVYDIWYNNLSFKQQICNWSENCDNKEEPEELRRAPIIILKFYILIFERYNW